MMFTGDKTGDENVVICEQSTSQGYMAIFHHSIVVYSPDIGMKRALCCYILSLVISIPAHICGAAEATSAFSTTVD